MKILIITCPAKCEGFCTNLYHTEFGSGIIYNDKDIAVNRPTDTIKETILSDKDM